MPDVAQDWRYPWRKMMVFETMTQRIMRIKCQKTNIWFLISLPSASSLAIASACKSLLCVHDDDDEEDDEDDDDDDGDDDDDNDDDDDIDGRW